MKWFLQALIGMLLAGIASVATAQNEQFIPVLSYRIGPYAAGGSGYFGGAIDYWTLVNLNGGINGVKIVWEECETEYNASRGVECYERLKTRRGGASTVEPLSTGIAYGLFERVANDKIPMTTNGYGLAIAADGRTFPWVFPLGTTYWDQAAAMIAYLSQKVGGEANLKGKKIVFMYHDSAYGKEPIPVFDALAARDGFELTKIPLTPPATTQESQWLQVRQLKPDYVILWGYGVMNPVAIKTAAKLGFPRDRMLGVWWAGSEEDIIPAGDAAKGYVAAAFSAHGTNFPVMQDIVKKVYGAGKGNLEDKARVGSIYHTRGITYAIMITEAIRQAQNHFGKGKVMTPEQVRWGLENLALDQKRLDALGFAGVLRPISTSCADHMGSTWARIQTWDGSKWSMTSDFMQADDQIIKPMVKTAADKYMSEKKIPHRSTADCQT